MVTVWKIFIVSGLENQSDFCGMWDIFSNSRNINNKTIASTVRSSKLHKVTIESAEYIHSGTASHSLLRLARLSLTSQSQRAVRKELALNMPILYVGRPRDGMLMTCDDDSMCVCCHAENCIRVCVCVCARA